MITTYTEKDFANMKFNPLVKEDMVKAYPELKQIAALWQGNDQDKVIRYLLLVYDDTSVMAQSIRDITMRKRKGAEISGLIAIKNERQLDAITTCTSVDFVQAVAEYMRLFKKPRLWQIIVSNEMLFEEYNSRLMQRISNTGADEKKELDAVNVKSKLRQEAEAINVALDGYYMEFFGKDESFKKSVHHLNFSPEGQAARLT